MRLVAAMIVVILGLMVFQGSASAEEPVYWKQLSGTDLPGAGKSVKEPSQIIVYKRNSAGTVCSGCGWRLVNLEWEDWGEERAVASGKAIPMGGPGTCGWPPEGCQYPNKKATVYLSGVASNCGERRYMRAATIVDGFGARYPKVNCRGEFMVKPTPKPKPSKPRLKRVTAQSVFNKTAHEDGRLEYYDKQSLRCNRVNRLRFRCRGRWIERLDIHGEKFVYRVKGRGWVKRSGSYYTCKIRFGYRITTPQGSQRFPSDVEWGFYVVR